MIGRILAIAVFLFAFQICFIESAQVKRALLPETVEMAIYFKQSCRRLDDIISSIRISRVSTAETCLPISLNATNPDFNDLNYHVMCTNLGPRRSLLRIVEIFPGTNDEETLPPGFSYILSLRSAIPFRVNTTGVTYQYRPKCVYETDVCDRTVSVVSLCRERPVNADDDIDEHGYVEAVRRVYVILPGQTIHSCHTNGVCCPYIRSDSTGICRFYNRSITHNNPWDHHGNDNNHHHNDEDYEDDNHDGHGHGHGNNHGHHDHDDDDHHHGHGNNNGHHDHDDDHYDNYHGHNGHHNKDNKDKKEEEEEKEVTKKQEGSNPTQRHEIQNIAEKIAQMVGFPSIFNKKK